jgi:hypothetical protein
MRFIGQDQQERIIEYLFGLVKSHAVFAIIQFGLFAIPLKAKRHRRILYSRT